VLNHVAVPSDALREMARVCSPDGVVLASTFREAPAHPTKDDVDRALAPFGFRMPAWHDRMKDDIEPRTATPERLLDEAARAGLPVAHVVEHRVDAGFTAPEMFVALRFGMATVAPFLAGLDAATRERAFAAAVDALGPSPPPFVVTLLVLAARPGET
jgi:hypothetical protein